MQKTRQRAALTLGGALIVESMAFGAGGAAVPANKFPFGISGTHNITLDTLQAYSPEIGSGFEIAPFSGDLPVHKGVIVSEKPFQFALDVENGNYDVTLTFGGVSFASETTVKAESRRLLLENVHVAPREKVKRKFTVNVRDGQLNLEFLGDKTAVAALRIKRNNDAPTVYIAGDSTVCDYKDEPYAGWGQILPRFFRSGIAVANHAQTGRSLKSFIWEKRFDAIMATIKPGDYLFVQFTHNDQKPGAAHVEPFTTFKEQLQIYIDAAREHGATPVLVTSMHRRKFDENGKIINTLLEYPEAMRQKAREQNVALIDLNSMSKEVYEAWGPDTSKQAFVHFPAHTFPNQAQELKDDTHFTAYGAYEMAKCVVLGIKNSNLDLKHYLNEDATKTVFVPAHPDALSTVQIPASPFAPLVKPEGS